ncbi:uncharacterized protein [Rutidosis leptorrhynchoides]|uniref:uncharacterized protein n=1 Tax=Rutidosis leptorrhynchoides TaxID=125765 RepID=UPI003A98FE37
MLSIFGPKVHILSSKRNPVFFLFKPHTLTLAMATDSVQDNSRPTCPSCSRPTRVCLCTRFKTPILENTIAVTVLQHSLEKKHPLNSARIATLGLKNINIAHVSDVISDALFDIHFFKPDLDLGHHESVKNHKKFESLHPADISFTIDKRGSVTSLVNNWSQSQDFDNFLVDKDVINGVQNGFTVKKMQRWSDGNYVQEFEMVVPSGSILLFPCENSIGIEDVDFNVKNLIVLDGTWAKATRMYKENPWLRLFPHLKLDIGKLSVYGEVRRQPKAGYLSSIESIVYTLKAIGKEDIEGLDCLLDVFESMIGDQRRCKNERLDFESSSSNM